MEGWSTRHQKWDLSTIGNRKVNRIASRSESRNQVLSMWYKFNTGHQLALSGWIRLRSCLFCEGRISVLKRWFKTPIQNAVHGSTVYASLEKKTISWACTAHCSRLLFELKWTGKAFIWRHLNVVICDFAFMLPPESAFCPNHDRKRTFLGVLNQRFQTTFIRK